MNNKGLTKYHSIDNSCDFYISKGNYNMKNDNRKIKHIRIYSCIGIDPDNSNTDNIFPDTQLAFTIDADKLLDFTFTHNGNGLIYNQYSSNITIMYIHPDVNIPIEQYNGEPWIVEFTKCFAVVFFEDNKEKDNSIKETYCRFCALYNWFKNDFEKRDCKDEEKQKTDYTVALVRHSWFPSNTAKKDASRTVHYKHNGFGYKLNYCPECGKALKSKRGK